MHKHGAGVACAKLSADLKRKVPKNQGLEIGPAEMKAYVEESSSQTWHVYEAKKKWRGEAWIKVLTCQCGVTWGMDQG